MLDVKVEAIPSIESVATSPACPVHTNECAVNVHMKTVVHLIVSSGNSLIIWVLP